MIAYPLPAWNWRQAQPPAHREQNSVSALLGRLQAHWQRNLMLTQAAADEETGVSSGRPRGITPAGESKQMLTDVCEGVALKHRARQIVTALRTRDHRLQLESWRVNADGSVIRTGASGPQPESVAQLDLTRAKKYVVAYRSLHQELKLVSWDVSNTGAIYRAGESSAWSERVRQVRLCTVQDQMVATACILRARQLKLISWRLDDDSIVVGSSQTADQADVHEVAVAAVPQTASTSLVATLSRTGAQELVLQLWQVTATGEFEAGAQAILPIAASQLHLAVDTQGHLIAAMRTPSGHLRWFAWEVSAQGESLRLLYASEEGSELVRRLALATCPDGILIAVSTTTSQLNVILWQPTVGGEFHPGAESPPQRVAAGPLLLCAESLDGYAQFFAGVRTSPGHFKLKTWHL